MTSPIAVSLRINGARTVVSVEPRRILADVLRDEFGLRSIHLGCEQGLCGGCMVLVDGEPANSCMLLAVQAEERDVTTLEGLSETPQMRTLQEAFREKHALQCGYCTPGMLISLHALSEEDLDLSAADVRERLRGNLCRCTGYQSIVAAALAAMGASHAAGASPS